MSALLNKRRGSSFEEANFRRSSVFYEDVYSPEDIYSPRSTDGFSLALDSFGVKHDDDIYLSDDQKFHRRFYKARILPDVSLRGNVISTIDTYYNRGNFSLEMKNYLGYVYGRHSIIGLMHDIETNPGPTRLFLPDEDLIVLYSHYKGAEVMREKFLTFLSSQLPSHKFDLFLERYKSAVVAPNTSKCKCFVCEFRQNDSPWANHFKPRPVEFVIQAQLVYRHIEHVVTTYNGIYTTHVIDNIIALLIDHSLFYDCSPKSTEGSTVAMMDSIGRFVFGDTVRDMERIADSSQDATEALEMLVEDGIKMPDIAKLAESAMNINKDGINMPAVNRLAEALESGVKIDTGAVGVFFTKMGTFLEPFINMVTKAKEMVNESPLPAVATKLFVMMAIEYLRIQMTKKSKYYNALAILNCYLAYTSDSKPLQAFASGYYGCQAMKVVYTMITTYLAKDDDDEEEFEAFSDADSEAFIKGYMETMFQCMTGLTDYITVKNAIYTFGLYKAFITGSSFTIDSMADMTLKISNWLGSSAGTKFFRSVYTAYPALYSIQDDLNKIKDLITHAKPFSQSDLALFMKTIEEIRSLQKVIVIKPSHNVYITMINHLEKEWDKLHIILKSKGIITTGLVPTAYVVGIVGPPNVGKSQILTGALEILIKNNHSSEFYEEFKTNRNRYWYAWKRQKFADSFVSETKVVINDDLGAVQRSSGPESCDYLWWISKVNNIPDKVDKSSVGEKDMVEFKPSFIGWTSNDTELDIKKMWATRPEAVYRRMINGSKSSWYIEVHEKYRIEDKSSNWGYRVDRDALAFDKLANDVFTVVEYNMELGHNFNEVTSGSPFGKRYTWHEWLVLLDSRFKAHRTREMAMLANNRCLAEDPKYNPFIQATVEAHSDDIEIPELEPIPREEEVEVRDKNKKSVREYINNFKGIEVFKTAESYLNDTGSTYSDALLELCRRGGLKLESAPETFNDLRDIDLTDYNPELVKMLWSYLRSLKLRSTVDRLRPLGAYSTLDEFVDDVWRINKQKISAARTLGVREFASWSSTLIYGCISDYEWANFANANYKILEPLYITMVKDCCGLVSPSFVMRVDNIFNLANCERSFKGYIHMMLDLAFKFQQLGKLWELTFCAVWKMITRNKISVVSVVRDSADIIARNCVTSWIIAEDIYGIFYGSFMHYNNVWVAGFVGSLAGLAFTAKTAVNIAHADYDRKARVITNPLKKKCKDTSLKVQECKCSGCMKIRDTYYKKIEERKNNSAMSAIDGNALVNLEQKAMATAKRNVWNVQFIIPGADRPICFNNATCACTEIVFMPHHFIHECKKLVFKYGGPGIMRFVNYNATRHFDVNFHDICRSLLSFEQYDLCVWVNNGYCSFGGGITNIINYFPYADERPPTTGYQYMLKFNHVKGIMEESKLVNVNIGTTDVNYTAKSNATGEVKYYYIKAFVINTMSTHGNCGCPLFSADDINQEQKIHGIIVSGSVDGTSPGKSFVTGITRDMIEDIIKNKDLMIYDTSDLPTTIVETELLPEAFCASLVIPDTHPMPTHNTIRKTPLHGIFGSPDKIPCFISVVEIGDEEAFCVQNRRREKYATNGPACSDFLMTCAVEMMVSALESAIPLGEERHYTLTVNEAINGARGEAPMSTITSPGAKYILQGVTKKMIVTRNADELDLSSDWGQQYLKDVHYKLECYENRKIPLNYANEFPKVECLPVEKVLSDGKCRLVCGTDADNCTAVKCHYAWLNRLLKSVGFDAGILIGMNPNAFSSHIMALMLMFWNNIQDGDVSAWDASFFRYLTLACRDVALKISHCTDEKAINAMKTIAESMLYIVHVAHIRFNRGEFVSFAVFYEWMHGMISGDYLTLLFNTLGNGILARYNLLCAYAMVHKGVHYLEYDPSIHGMIDLEFLSKNFRHFATGDDSLQTTSPSLDWYTIDLIKEIYAQHGVKFTPSAKDGNFIAKSLVPYSTTPADFSFCKRYPVYNEEYNRWVWLLDWGSIMNSLYYSENFREKEQVIDDAFKNMSLYGNKFFEEKGIILRSASWDLFKYRSPFDTFAIALAAAVGEIDEKMAVRIKIAIDSGFITPECVLELKVKAKLALALGTHKLAIGVNSSNSFKTVSEEFKENYEELVECDSLVEPDVKVSQEVLNNEEKKEIELVALPDEDYVALMDTDATFKFDNLVEVTENVGSSRPTDVYSDKYSNIEDFFKRPTLITRITATAVQTQNSDLYSFNIGPYLTSVKLWEEKTNGYAGCTGTAVVTITLNATNMQKGAWLLRYIPCYVNNVTGTSMNQTLMQKSQHPGIMFTTDALKGDSIVLRIPYVAPSSYYKFNNGLYDWGTVFVTVMSPLKNSIAALCTSVDMTVWLHFEDMKLVVPTVQAMSESVDVATKPISTALNATAKIVSKLSAIPPLAAYAKPAEWVLRGAARTAAAFGYSKPTVYPAMTINAALPSRYAGVADGADLSTSFTLSAVNQLSKITYMTPRTEDEMSFSFLKRIWAYFGSYTVTTSDVSGTIVQTIPIAPSVFYSLASKTVGSHTINAKNYAPFAHITNYFSAWRGSIEIKIVAVSTVETGRFKIQFLPSPDVSGGSSLDMTVMTVVLDLSKSKEVTFRVPFMSQYHYISPGDPNGTIVVSVLNAMRAPETVSQDVQFLMFVRAGEDYEVAGPVPNTGMGNVVAMSDSITFGDQPIHDLTTNYAEESVGEMFMSVKQLLMRTNYMSSSSVATNFGASYSLDYIEAVALDGSGALVGPTWGGTCYPHIISMYAFRRGSHIIGVGSNGGSWFTRRGPKYIETFPSDSQTTRPWDWKVNYISNTAVGSANSTLGTGNKVPYMCDTPFTINRLATDDVAHSDGDEAWGAIACPVASAQRLTWWKSYGDDFQCGFFVCTPLVMTTYI